ncbi:exodeoxyribonuclease VII small subunit [bacterium]|nr:exodeoxyribonuclease VII small subunit [bacterium]
MVDLSELTFEQALERLEQIVRELDAGEISLEESLQRFEEGMALKKLCLERLAEAEARVEQYLAEEPEAEE